MTRHFQLIRMLALLAGNVLPASAQTPETDMLAAGADIGAFFPDDEFENSSRLMPLAIVHHAVQRSRDAGLDQSRRDGFAEDHFRQVKLLFNGVYNWEGACGILSRRLAPVSISCGLLRRPAGS